MVTKNTDVVDIFDIFREEQTEQIEYPTVVNFADEYLYKSTSGIYSDFYKKRNAKFWRASSINSEMCPRYECFVKSIHLPPRLPKKLETPTDPGLSRIYDVGTDAHYRWQNSYLGPAGVLYGDWTCTNLNCRLANVLFRGKMNNHLCEACGGRKEYVEPTIKFERHNIVGHCDGILQLDKNYMLEFKTCNPFAFSKLTGPYQKHIEQASLYTYGINKRMSTLDLQVEGAIIVYLDKGTPNVKQYAVPYNSEIAEKLLETVNTMNDYLNNETKNAKLPSRHCECSMSNPRGKKCPFNEICYSCETSQDLRNKNAE